MDTQPITLFVLECKASRPWHPVWLNNGNSFCRNSNTRSVVSEDEESVVRAMEKAVDGNPKVKYRVAQYFFTRREDIYRTEGAE